MSNALLALLLALQVITLPLALNDMAIREGADPALAACIVSHESNWNTNLVSKDDDTGLFQIIPSTAEWVAGKMGLERYDLKNPVDNMSMGLWILARYPEWYNTLPMCEG
jgi:soluble lytic murein transglycosylase